MVNLRDDDALTLSALNLVKRLKEIKPFSIRQRIFEN
jgi:hypothetical protein